MPAKFKLSLCKHFYNTCNSLKFTSSVIVNISRIPERERNGEGTNNEADISKEYGNKV